MPPIHLRPLRQAPPDSWIVWTADTGIIITGARLTEADDLACGVCGSVVFAGSAFARQTADARVALKCQACGEFNEACGPDAGP